MLEVFFGIRLLVLDMFSWQYLYSYSEYFFSILVNNPKSFIQLNLSSRAIVFGPKVGKKMAQIQSELKSDLNKYRISPKLRPIWPTFGPNLTSLVNNPFYERVRTSWSIMSNCNFMLFNISLFWFVLKVTIAFPVAQ